jgi:capsid protein
MIPRGLPPIADWNWHWTWDGREHVDPGKEANAAETRLRTHTTTLAHEYAKQGKDWQVELMQRAKELAQMRALGLLAELEPAESYTQQPAAGDEEGDD